MEGRLQVFKKVKNEDDTMVIEEIIYNNHHGSLTQRP